MYLDFMFTFPYVPAGDLKMVISDPLVELLPAQISFIKQFKFCLSEEQRLKKAVISRIQRINYEVEMPRQSRCSNASLAVEGDYR